jgi:methylated-DNA-[protein]-cysteine S-methyltransferase
VGHALGKNPIPVIIPCHRVLGSDGGLHGFGGGLPMKEFLLNLESTRRSDRH